MAVAESLTGGRVASELAAAPHASSWFRGGVVAYANEVKYGVLGVPVGPVISDTCAQAMAAGVARLTAADYAVAVTGVGGPDEQEGQPVGTVFIAVYGPAGNRVEHYRLSGEPEEIVAQAAAHALHLLNRRAGDDG